MHVHVHHACYMYVRPSMVHARRNVAIRAIECVSRSMHMLGLDHRFAKPFYCRKKAHWFVNLYVGRTVFGGIFSSIRYGRRRTSRLACWFVFSQAQGGQLRSAVGVMARRMEGVLEMESDDSDEDSCSDADSNEEEGT